MPSARLALPNTARCRRARLAHLWPIVVPSQRLPTTSGPSWTAVGAHKCHLHSERSQRVTNTRCPRRSRAICPRAKLPTFQSDVCSNTSVYLLLLVPATGNSGPSSVQRAGASSHLLVIQDVAIERSLGIMGLMSVTKYAFDSASLPSIATAHSKRQNVSTVPMPHTPGRS